eukprot:SAG31_NODE_14888_length_782_cov_0.877013_1_plen_69_part_00
MSNNIAQAAVAVVVVHKVVVGAAAAADIANTIGITIRSLSTPALRKMPYTQVRVMVRTDSKMLLPGAP